MCNAWNHPAGCNCGFGPPYHRFQGTIEPGPRVDWTDAATWSERSFLRGLLEAGFSRADLSARVRDYRRAGLPIRKERWLQMDERGRQEIKSTVNQVLGIQKPYIRQVLRWRVAVPLFRFHAPDVPNSRITYTEVESRKQEGGWSIKVLGTGMGATQQYHVSYSCSFECNSGECKDVFVSIPIRVKRIDIYEQGRRLGHGVQIAAEKSRSARTYTRGIRSCPEADCIGQLPRGSRKIDDFFLAADTTGDIATYRRSWTATASKDAEIGLNVREVEACLQVKIEPEHELELEFALPAGFDYRLYDLPGMHGIAWKFKAPASAGKHRTVR